jgi:cysteine desulfurase/selenocysteine lyase
MKFEAGTPNIAGVVGLDAAIKFIASVGDGDLDAAFELLEAREKELTAYATDRLLGIPGLRLTGTAREKAGVLAFVLDFAHPHDVGTILDQEGIAIRAGHHCAQPVMQRFKIPATARASFAFYNTKDEVDALASAVEKCIEVFK